MKYQLKILIVEDEMSIALELEMMIEELGYQLIGIVDNGEEAITLMLDKSPDLILMDININGKYSGLEVAEKTKHLPVAILFITSYQNQEIFERAKLTNFAGYLTKPLNKISIQGAIEMAIKFLNYKNPLLLTSDLAVTNQTNPSSAIEKEAIFISRFKKEVIDDLGNSNLTVEEIAKNMGISRMQLHRKIKALTNLTTSKLILKIRLEKATKLLEEQKLNISEIAYQTGFSNPNHFSRAFKQIYGMSPSKTRK